jgi:hypothetical protein
VDEKQVEQEIGRLYAGPLEEFIASRKALEEKLRTEGSTESARRVKDLRKPSLSAWAINQLSRARDRDVESLIRAGEDLREAQRRTLAGGGGATLQEAGSKRRRQVDTLLEAARQILQKAGHPSNRSQLDQIENTLLAAATDEVVRDQLRRGTLEKPAPPPSDFGGLAEMAAGAPPRREDAPKSRTDRARQAPPSLVTPRQGADERRRERARQRAEELEQQASDAEAEARRLRQEAAMAEERATKARTSAQRAEAKAKSARERADKSSREPG